MRLFITVSFLSLLAIPAAAQQAVPPANGNRPREIASNADLAVDGGGTTPASVVFKDGTSERTRLTSNGAGVTETNYTNAFKIWHFANGPMAFATNGGERMRILADGRVVINTKDPQGGFARFSVLETSGTNPGAANILWLTSPYTDQNLSSRASINAAYTYNANHGGSLIGMNTSAQAHTGGAVRTAIGNEILTGVCCDSTATATVENAIGTYIQLLGNSTNLTNGRGVYIADIPAASAHGIFQIGGDDLNFFAGNVGIGTTVPGARLHITGQQTPLLMQTPTGGQLKFIDTNYSVSYPAGILLDMDANSLIRVSNMQIGFQTLPVINSTAAGKPLFLNNTSANDVVIGAAGYSTRLRVEGTGTSTFAGAVTVAGDLTVDGNLAAKYQDLAEWVPAASELSPGTVVVLDPSRPNSVMASSRQYDTTVAGVVSAQPGIALGQAGLSKELVATTGRVRVRVDATRAAIAIGDLLVTSDKPGVAMKSIPLDIQGAAIHRPGTIVGKALETLDSGEGEILVLLSLQ